jgi:hypothetical protein
MASSLKHQTQNTAAKDRTDVGEYSGLRTSGSGPTRFAIVGLSFLRSATDSSEKPKQKSLQGVKKKKAKSVKEDSALAAKHLDLVLARP